VLKTGRPLIITGLLNKIIAMSTCFTPTSMLLTPFGGAPADGREAIWASRLLVPPPVN
jgi:hypothetical protein